MKHQPYTSRHEDRKVQKLIQRLLAAKAKAKPLSKSA
jgi:hypothetical protein